MKLSAIAVAFAWACATTTPSPSKSVQVPSAEVTPEEFCARFVELKNSQCGGFARMPLPTGSCVDEARKDLAANDRTGLALRKTGRCMVDNSSCEGVLKCVAALQLESATDLRDCNDPPRGRAVGIPRAEYEQRNGAGITRFSEARSSREKPVENCGIRVTNTWLATLACDDGSRPLHGGMDAERARAGSVGYGGRCHSIIDLYRVRCPEASYDIFTDGYVCPLPK